MKLIITAIIAAIGLSTVSADVYVKPYFKKNGTYVQGHYRSNPDGNFYNNWSTKSNVNPYTGSLGSSHQATLIWKQLQGTYISQHPND